VEQMFRWNFACSATCDCDGATVQSMGHLIDECPIRNFSGRIESLYALTDEAREWLDNFNLNV